MKPLPSNERRLVSGLVIAGAAMIAIANIGCASSGLSAREGGARSQGSFVAALDNDFAAAPTKPRARFKPPASIAVAQVGEVSPPQKMIDALRADKDVFSRVQPIPATDPTLQDSNQYHYQQRHGPYVHTGADTAKRGLDNLRNLAAASGADYLLLVGGTVDRTERGTALSAANLTIVGMFIVPSHKTTAVMKASGAMIDVKTGGLVSLSSVDRQGSTLATYAARDGQPLEFLAKMRDRVSVDLAKQVITDLKLAPAAELPAEAASTAAR